MSMLNQFRRSSDKHNPVQFKVAYVKCNDDTKIKFSYYKLDREDITEKDFLKGIELQGTKIVIRTISEYDFKKQTKIIINNFQYSVESIYKEDQESENGPFRRNLPPYIYLTLNR